MTDTENKPKTELPFSLEQYGYLYTAVYNLPDGRKVAAPILPADTEYEYSSSRSMVTSKGQLVRDRVMTYFIKPPTYYELTNKAYRTAARSNKQIMSSWGVFNLISLWMRIAAQRGVKVMRLFYGGDPFGKYAAIRRLESRYGNDALIYAFVSSVMKRYCDDLSANVYSMLLDEDREDVEKWENLYPRPRDIELHLWTANTERVNELAEAYFESADYEHRITFVSEAQSYRDLPLYCAHRVSYHWDHEPVDKITEFEVAPNMSLSPVGLQSEVWEVTIPKGAYQLWKDAGTS